MHSDLTISQADPRPLYQQVKEQIRHRVAIGDWVQGAEIPSIRTLAAAIRVSVITIKRAYLELEMEGVIQTRQGRGSFVSDNVQLGDTMKEQELEGHLRSAVQTALLMNLSEDELIERLREVRRKDPQGRS